MESPNGDYLVLSKTLRDRNQQSLDTLSTRPHPIEYQTHLAQFHKLSSRMSAI
ncbi:hypothetical protein GXM_08475 [Nostoc sphaeroides CCNUC1]|uniref:Uncharacterized protein n=1 Tax=Nostoc sphaeroides CCNUC1 TaxID=2653204 RepID=A0A5P8WEI5_9NOSO|nr:hypothetical protein GXM_08475 [Nostoc sphaeroides CCNUC1]